MPYRDTRDALEHRLQLLEARLLEMQTRAAELEGLRDAIKTTQEEIARTRETIWGTLEVLPLDSVEVASPCPMRWEAMKGDDRTRYCGECRKNVYNLSDMTREEAQAFLAEKTGEVCVQLFKREDGTVLTADCPVGVRRKVGRRVSLFVLGASAVATTATAAYAVHYYEQEECEMETPQHIIQQAPVAPVAAPVIPTQESQPQQTQVQPTQRPIRHVVGRLPRRPWSTNHSSASGR